MKRREFIKVGLIATALAVVPPCKLFPGTGDTGGFSSLAAAGDWKLAAAPDASADDATLTRSFRGNECTLLRLQPQ